MNVNTADVHCNESDGYHNPNEEDASTSTTVTENTQQVMQQNHHEEELLERSESTSCKANKTETSIEKEDKYKTIWCWLRQEKEPKAEQANKTDAKEEQKEDKDAPKPILQKIFEELGSSDSFLNSGEGMDIYQLVAFQCECRPGKKIINLPWRYVFEYDIYYYNLFKAFITFFVQIASIFVLLDYAWLTVKKEADKDFCDHSGDHGPRTMAISYTLFLSLIMWSTVQSGQNSGFYHYCDYETQKKISKIVDYTWLTFGRTLCHAVILSAFGLSFFIIFYTTDPMDIILNAVALLFIADIDNMVVSPSDYDDMYQWFKNPPNKWDYYQVHENQGVTQKSMKRVCCDGGNGNGEGCGRCSDLVCFCVRFFIGRFIKIAVDVFAFCMVILAPLLIIVCY
eukprot:CAMPEP_0201571114 /NCGR_PEP_ID=MMETSP0190_2-20130828/13720_1 /ASSEMBLY_ACC=CAM_ASM_000263 /TAXON_ID=37353 /ORGANISM="Rosalina sp." /LENGTH=396 /DNA_ID=CAMNT_0047995413 /DNA_START=101 /DNA_END=1291 /DNA_ORIENTATION=+